MYSNTSILIHSNMKIRRTDMTSQRFKDLLFQILNENDTFIADIELNDSGNYFLISCIDGSKFSLSIQEAFTRFITPTDLDKSDPQEAFESYIETHTRDDFLTELKWLARNNPYVFQILLVVLKLSELGIISDEQTQDIMVQIHPYAQDLKEEWENFYQE